MTAVFDYILKPPVGYKKLKNRRTVLAFVYAVIALIGGGSAFLCWKYGFLFPVLALTVGIDAALIFLTWKKTRPEYEYLIEAGEFSFAIVYSGKTRHTVLNVDLADVQFICPSNGLYDSKLRDFAPEKEISGVFTEEQKNYFMLFLNEADEPTVFYFHADAELVRAIRKHNPKTVLDPSLK